MGLLGIALGLALLLALAFRGWSVLRAPAMVVSHNLRSVITKACFRRSTAPSTTAIASRSEGMATLCGTLARCYDETSLLDMLRTKVRSR